jgi:hypothetical protein
MSRRLVGFVLLCIVAPCLIVASIAWINAYTSNIPLLPLQMPYTLREVRFGDNDSQHIYATFTTLDNTLPDFSKIGIYQQYDESNPIVELENPIFFKNGTDRSEDLYTTILPINDAVLSKMGLDENGLPINQGYVDGAFYFYALDQKGGSYFFELQDRTSNLY